MLSRVLLFLTCCFQTLGLSQRSKSVAEDSTIMPEYTMGAWWSFAETEKRRNVPEDKNDWGIPLCAG